MSTNFRADGSRFTKMRKSVKIAISKGLRPEMDLVRPAFSRSVGYLSKSDVETLFRVIPEESARDRLLFDLIYRFGLRRTEAALIRREHLSAGRIWITRLKGGISGEYPVHPITRRLIWAHMNGRDEDRNPYLFTSRQSSLGPMSQSMIYTLFRRYASAANVPADRCHPHVLRHSIAVHLMNAGWDAADVQDWLGHRDIASTMVYAAITNKRREAKYEEALLSEEIAAIDFCINNATIGSR